MNEFVEIPAPEDDEESLISYFRDFLGTTDDLEELADALDLGCDPPNSRANLDNVEVKHVSIDGDSITIEYFVELSEYQACKDVNGYYTFARTLTGKQIGDAWRFKKHIYPEERSTYDEL